MMRRATCVGLAAALYGASVAATADAPHTGPVTAAQRIARPFALPALWRNLRDATVRGDPAAAIAAGRLITELLPDWTDGLIHVAWMCALDLASEERSVDRTLDRLLLAIGWLETAANERSADDPNAAAELCAGAATLLDARAPADSELALAFRARLDRDPADASHELLERATELAPERATLVRRAFATLRLVAGALRMGDLPRAQATFEAARRELAELARTDSEREALDALQHARPLRSYLDDPAALEALVENPWLTDVGVALREFRDG